MGTEKLTEACSKGNIHLKRGFRAKKRIRFIMALIIVLSMVLSMSVTGYAVTIKTVYVSLDDRVLNHAALEREGNLFLPLRSVCEALGYSVEWSAADFSITVKNEGKTVLFEPKKNSVTDQRHSYYVTGNYPDLGYIGGGCITFGGRIYIDSEIIESCFGVVKTYDRESSTWKLSVPPQDNMTAENVKTTYEDDRLQSVVQYPHITTPVKAAADKINAVILADVQRAEKETRESLMELGDYQGPNQFETYFNYKFPYRQGDLLPLVLTDYRYLGGAHGDEKQIAHTFDLKTGEEYRLADLMKEGSGYAEFISESVKDEIIKRGLAKAQLKEFVSIAPDQSYYLTNAGLVVYFQRYEYFPGAAGIQEFEFSWGDLAQYLKPEFIKK